MRFSNFFWNLPTCPSVYTLRLKFSSNFKIIKKFQDFSKIKKSVLKQCNSNITYFLRAVPIQVWSDCSISEIILSCSRVNSSFFWVFRAFFANSSGVNSGSTFSFFLDRGVECGELDARDDTTEFWSFNLKGNYQILFFNKSKSSDLSKKFHFYLK